MLKLLKSYKFWTALAGAVGMLFIAISDTLGISINVDGVKEIIMSICGILIVFGVVKKPKIKEPNEETCETQNETSAKKDLNKDCDDSNISLFAKDE